MPAPSAAEALYGHLPRAEPPTQQQHAQSLSAAMYPTLTPKPQPKFSNRQALLDGLRELNARIDARQSEEHKR